MTHQYKKLQVTIKMWMQFNVMPRTPLNKKHYGQAVDRIANVLSVFERSIRLLLKSYVGISFDMDLYV